MYIGKGRVCWEGWELEVLAADRGCSAFAHHLTIPLLIRSCILV